MKIAEKNPDVKAILLCKKVKDLKRYGVPTIKKLSNDLFSVQEVIEKPNKPIQSSQYIFKNYHKAESICF